MLQFYAFVRHSKTTIAIENYILHKRCLLTLHPHSGFAGYSFVKALTKRLRSIGFHTGFNNFSAGKPGKNDFDHKMLKICSRLLFSCCIISFFAFGCRKNVDNPSDEGIMSFLNNIKNKDGIDLNSIEGLNLYPDMLSPNNWTNIHCAQGDTAVLWGLRNNKLWLSLFNNQTKQQLMEWFGRSN